MLMSLDIKRAHIPHGTRIFHTSLDTDYYHVHRASPSWPRVPESCHFLISLPVSPSLRIPRSPSLHIITGRVGREMEPETGAAAYHRKTHVRFLQSRPVVGAITCDRHHLSLLPNRAVNDAWEQQTPSVSPPVPSQVIWQALSPHKVFFPDPAITSLPAASPLPSAGRARPSPKGSGLSKKVGLPHTAWGPKTAVTWHKTSM